MVAGGRQEVELGGLRWLTSAAEEPEQRTIEKTGHQGGFWGRPWSPVVVIDRRWDASGVRRLHRETEAGRARQRRGGKQGTRDKGKRSKKKPRYLGPCFAI